MDAIFYGIAIPQIRDPHFASGLAYTLDSTFTLLQASWIPGQVDIDERTESLKIQTFRCSIGSENEFEITAADAFF
ncbi:hypothetical protein D3C85_1750470 [compost metagenome]